MVAAVSNVLHEVDDALSFVFVTRMNRTY